jgi:hypothetical protein
MKRFFGIATVVAKVRKAPIATPAELAAILSKLYARAPAHYAVVVELVHRLLERHRKSRNRG